METIKRLLKYLKPYKTKFINAVLCMVLIAVFQSALMYLIKPAIDEIFRAKNVKLIFPIVAGIVVASFFKFIFSYLQSYILSWIGQRVIKDIRDEMYRKLINLSMPYFIKSSTGKLISRLTYDVALIQMAIVMIPRNTLRDGLQMFFYLGMLFYLNWKWTLAAIVAFPLISVVIATIGKKIRRRSKRVQALTAEIYSLLQEKITGIKLIKSSTTEQYESEVMEKQSRNYFDILMSLTKADVLQAPLIEFLAVFGIGIVIIWGGSEVINGTATQGTFIAFVAIIMSMYKPAKSLTNVNTDIQTAISAAERIFEIIDAKPTIVESADAKVMPEFSGEIKYENISFEYNAGKAVLKDISLSIKKGETLALVGPSGSGKTTFVSLLPRFFDTTSGKITIDGEDIKKFTLKSLRRQMGIVTQETILFNDTVANNIAYGMPDAGRDSIEAAAKKANAHDFIMKLPNQYDTVIGEKGVMLSGGERQRLAIARVILRDPQILILDEATSALDSESEILVQGAVAELMKGKTTIAIAHRLSTVKSADKIIVIDRHRIVDSGKHSELLEKSVLYRQLYELQQFE